MEEEDMFADLEKTLLEIMVDLNNSHKLETMQTKYLELTELNRICGPAYRGHLLLKATRAFQSKNYIDSVYNEAAALSIWMRYKFKANEVMESQNLLPTDGNLKDFLEKKNLEKDRSNVIQYIDSFLNDTPTKIIKRIEFSNVTELMNLCKDLPKEWTVIQLCKQVNTGQHLQTRDECLRCPLPIFLTLFCYPLSERFDHQPIKLVLNQEELKELYETSYDYFKGVDQQEIKTITREDFNTKILSKLMKLLGPWIVLFSGKPKTKDNEASEKKIYENVDTFASNSCHKFTNRQILLTCLVARRVFMLSNYDIIEASLEISKTQEEAFELIRFFKAQKSKGNIANSSDCNPVILVVDELIDFFYWEMCYPGQEFTRVESMMTLLQLYAYHEKNISNGYFKVKHRKGGAILNPDRTLSGITQRVQPLLATTVPNWTILLEKQPTFTDLQTMLSTSDIYVYCGHGTGFQFVSAYETCQLFTSAVVFLFGCSSVAFKADNGYSLASGAHQFYHVAKSPAVIGNINLVYSLWADLEFAVTFANWLSLPDVIWNTIPFKDDGDKFRGLIQKALTSSKKSPYLGKVVADFKQIVSIPIGTRAEFCYRGLPVYLEK